MKLIEKYKLIFVHIPKTAGVTITKALSPCWFGNDDVSVKQVRAKDIDDNIGVAHESAYETKLFFDSKQFDKDIGEWEDYHKFSSVRNPWEAEVSHWFFLVKRAWHNPYHIQASTTGFKETLVASEWRHHRFIHRCDNHPYPDSFSRFLFDDNTGELLVDDVLRKGKAFLNCFS